MLRSARLQMPLSKLTTVSFNPLTFRMYRPYYDQMKRNVFQPLCHQKISLIEFMALITLCTWNDCIDGQPDCYYPHCRPVRQNVICELQSFYAKDTPEIDPAFRLSSLLMLIPALEVSGISEPRTENAVPEIRGALHANR